LPPPLPLLSGFSVAMSCPLVQRFYYLLRKSITTIVL
jgi:hypothetical protein